jgi:hypothetical protein
LEIKDIIKNKLRKFWDTDHRTMAEGKAATDMLLNMADLKDAIVQA